MLREWIMISVPKEPDFFKSTVLGVDDEVQDICGSGGGELSHPFHGLLEKSSIEVRGGQRHLPGDDGGHPNTPILQDDDDLKPSNGFGRGQSVSSVSTGRCGGIGWKPKPICGLRLLGGAGGNAKKKMGPKSKAKAPHDGNYFLVYLK